MTELLKPREVAGALELTVGRIHQLLRAGKLRGFKVSGGRNGRWRIRKVDLIDYIEAVNRERRDY